ncbi:DUF3427 domain-containing protein [Glutamicibacter creatinolyticus]|uniref:DUF3427 domain-containing protein n=1 Tax=Glutamicibacter creatinolyticus TaxID=162496 RepID=UPI0037C05876
MKTSTFYCPATRPEIRSTAMLPYTLDCEEPGKVSGTSKEFDCKYVFATIQTLSQEGVLKSIGRDAFDYIIVDEAHRVGAASYIRVLNYLQPSFLLGLTATPERGDGFNIFEFFDYNVPYEIRLNHALEEGMLSPFHYYGIADIELEDGRQLSPQGHLRNLVDSKRVEHIIRAIEVYGQAGVDPRGLIFCSRSEEATEISNALNLSQLRGRTLRTVALSAKDSSEARAEAVRQLESGAIDYILTVDIFNEGVDIPSINQVIMLRQTASAIVFVQQLGRGLRKFRDKEYLVVIDFIGNYANNYLIPIALFGEESLNKEYLKEKLIAAEQSGVLPGLSSVRFDRISQERILDSINHTKLDSIRNLKSAVQAMKNRVGSRPKLWDFYRFESVDPVLLATKRNNYAQLLALLKIENNNLSENEDQALAVLSHEVLPAKRLHEFVLATALFRGQSLTPGEIKEVFEEAGLYVAYRTVESVISSFTLDNHAQVDLNRYKTGLAEVVDNRLKLRKGILDAYAHGGRFSEEVDDLLRTGTAIVEGRYLGGSPFVPGVQYSRKEVTRLLGMPRKWTSTLYGYKVDRSLGVCPIFVTLHKSDEVSASIAYQDELVDHGRMRWFTKARRTLQSNEIQPILRNEVTLHVFVKKDDAEGSDFFYLGEAKSSSAQQTQMPDDKGHALDVVVMDLIFSRPVSAALFDYFHPTLAIVD